MQNVSHVNVDMMLVKCNLKFYKYYFEYEKPIKHYICMKNDVQNRSTCVCKCDQDCEQ